MTSQPVLQTIPIHKLPNISQSKSNQTMKFGQSIEYNKSNIFLQNLCGKWRRETSSSSLFIFFKKLNFRCKQVVSSLVSIYFDSPQLVKANCVKRYTIDPEISSIFYVSEKGLRLVSPPHFVHDFSRKMFLMLHPINWPNFIVWLPLLVEILHNMCIKIVC